MGSERPREQGGGRVTAQPVADYPRRGHATREHWCTNLGDTFAMGVIDVVAGRSGEHAAFDRHELGACRVLEAQLVENHPAKVDVGALDLETGGINICSGWHERRLIMRVGTCSTVLPSVSRTEKSSPEKESSFSCRTKLVACVLMRDRSSGRSAGVCGLSRWPSSNRSPNRFKLGLAGVRRLLRSGSAHDGPRTKATVEERALARRTRRIARCLALSFRVDAFRQHPEIQC